MRVIFQINSNHEGKTFDIPSVHTEYMGKLSLRYFGPVVWEIMLPAHYKKITVLEKFKEEIRNWIPDCNCRLCKNYVSGVGYVGNIEC